MSDDLCTAAELAELNKRIEEAIPLVNIFQTSVPKGTPAGTVLLALSIMMGYGIKLGPTPEAQANAFQGAIDIIAGVLNGSIIIEQAREH